ncbi:hypothetical protein C8034_v009891 [Colletotrichum sidae]|uniref:Uncharacterized protein n=2 Tax=Colletotrichum orbiculare species complex TaxID=2707354 RepID=N4V155_COLOR|nr:hypothetical protein Cob_v006693 [Colletotrichum orbiculare MAFF 240422]TEA22451.1 hypothetical protein C8034_v009891 [Colletotrichum sidae]
MAASTDMPRLSFGASRHLDLSLDLPIVLLPPSDDPPTLVDDSDDDAQRTPTTAYVPRIPERNTRRTENEPAPSPSGSPKVPRHPIPSMQVAFAESFLEVADGNPAQKPKLKTADAKIRREELISQEREDDLPDMLWRYRPGQQQHELQKLMAQISFGVYLLLNGMANSAAQVVSILQGHIDEVDEFLEVVLEDFETASKDLKERIDYLRLPMENLEVFEKLLEDRKFRLEIVQGNEKIEHIVARTNIQLEQYDKDVQHGLAATKEFAIYLAQQNAGCWRQDRPDVADIYAAMKGNTEGWYNAFVELQAQGKELNSLVIKLSKMVAEMSRKAGEVSRRTWASIPPFTLPIQGARPEEASLNSPPFSPPPSRSPRRSTLRANSIGGSASTHRSSSNTTYFDMPLQRPAASASPDQQSMRTVNTTNTNKTTYTARSTHTSRSNHTTSSSRTNGSFHTVSSIRTKNSGHTVKSNHSSSSKQSVKTALTSTTPKLTLETPDGPITEPVGPEEMEVAFDDAPLYILQPRTYTPQPPEPVPEPTVTETPPYPQQDSPMPTKKSSLRQRVSLKTTPPESILIPPPASDLHHTERESPRQYQAPDSAYGSDIDQRPRYPVTNELSPPGQLGVLPSPRSEHQYYRPVQASPHSPLQQRPLTAGAQPRSPYAPSVQSGQSEYYPSHQRNAPSRLGGASTLSTVTTMTYDSQATASGEKRLKKKRSAFGWLKKAFSLDEEERMVYEQRRQQQAPNIYYDARSPKFLDGKRVTPR